MLTIFSAVEQVVSGSEFAIEGLQTACLNLNAYADTIKQQVETLARKPAQKGSIVVALARLSNKYRANEPEEIDFQLYNLVSRSGLTELTYPKSPELQKGIGKIFERPDVQTAPFCVATVGLGEVSIITHDKLAESIRTAISGYSPTLYLPELSSLTMQVGIETIDIPRQSYTVIKQLALRDITIVEYITSPTELTIILHSRDLKESFIILHDRFFAHT
ncbi:MAG TPA: hypothetical protein VMB52_03580 [Verrucomicrobiae bacterium]|nr:hypothetical protein [Verrucomicrobiae bacterium]